MADVESFIESKGLHLELQTINNGTLVSSGVRSTGLSVLCPAIRRPALSLMTTVEWGRRREVREQLTKRNFSTYKLLTTFKPDNKKWLIQSDVLETTEKLSRIPQGSWSWNPAGRRRQLPRQRPQNGAVSLRDNRRSELWHVGLVLCQPQTGIAAIARSINTAPHVTWPWKTTPPISFCQL